MSLKVRIAQGVAEAMGWTVEKAFEAAQVFFSAEADSTGGEDPGESTGGGDLGGEGAQLTPSGYDPENIINSSLRPARPGAEESRALQALKKKIDRGNPAYAGLPKTQGVANEIIREVLEADNPVIRQGTSRNQQNYVDIFNPSTGRGVRIINGQFDTFVNLQR